MRPTHFVVRRKYDVSDICYLLLAQFQERRRNAAAAFGDFVIVGSVASRKCERRLASSLSPLYLVQYHLKQKQET